MKVTTHVIFSQEIEVDVSKEDILAILSANPGLGETWFLVISRFHTAMQALPESVIPKMTPPQRQYMGEFLA